MSTIANLCDLLALLRKAPRTADELAVITNRSVWGIRRNLDCLHAEGHLYIEHTLRTSKGSGRRARVYAWQPSLFERPDNLKATDSRVSGVPNA